MPISRSATRVAGSISGRRVVAGGSSGNPLMFDGFDYSVGKTEENTTAEATFVTAGWTGGCKRLPTNSGANGYLYTVTQAEMEATTGHTGPLPGSGSRCLKMEVPPDTDQTDFWLGLAGAANSIPADVWFQFWLYSPHYGDETANISGRHKFLYPSNNDYPSSTDKWLFVTTSFTYAPYNTSAYSDPTSGEITAVLRDFNDGTVWYSPAGDNNDKLGPNMVTAANGYMSANEWTLWKIHFDTSVADEGKFEIWLRPYGGSWRKTHEWIGGTTPDFSWTGFTPGGHSAMRMPSTIPGNAVPNVRGAQYYMDDFAMATSESALPVYGD